MYGRQLHKAQVSILYSLRRARAARFSDLLRPTGLDGDAFKFHLRRLSKLALLEKTVSGEYRLTPKGKEFSNNLDDVKLRTQKQPKLSVIVVAAQKDDQGQERYLCQERLRNPYWGFWSLIGGPIRWGDTPEEAAQYELRKQTGLDASFAVRAFCRKRDYTTEDDFLLEDKLFTIVEAIDLVGTLANHWKGGNNEWLTLPELQAKEKYFAETLEILDMLKKDIPYVSQQAHYNQTDY